MGLPQLNSDLRYTLKLPTSGKKVEYRPFFVREEKMLMMALENDNQKEQIEAVKNVVQNCTFFKIDVSELPMIDLEWIFLNLRIKSKGETTELAYKCKGTDTTKDNKKCDHINKVTIDLTKIKVEEDSRHNQIIMISGDIGMKMKYPNLHMIDDLDDVNESDIRQNMDMLINSVESIFEGESVHMAKDIDKQDIENFIDSMTDEQFEKVKMFFDTMPKLKTVAHIDCKECGAKEDIPLEGIRNFFV